MFVLYENLARAVAWLGHVLGANGSETLGVLPAFVLAVSRGVQAHGMNHLLQQMLVASWPLLLVTFGTVLSREGRSMPVHAESSSRAEKVTRRPDVASVAKATVEFAPLTARLESRALSKQNRLSNGTVLVTEPTLNRTALLTEPPFKQSRNQVFHQQRRPCF